MLILLLNWLYLLVQVGLAIYGLLGLLTLFWYWWFRPDHPSLPPLSQTNYPLVTLQLPIFNERDLVGRLIESSVSLEYPPGRLQIQLLDDSTDDTTTIAANLIAHYRQQGVNISHCHRQQRQGYKAGALNAALAEATGEYIAIFDADFLPPPDFLQRVIPHFMADSRLGAVQTRWGHLNAQDSLLTSAQAIALDKHFAIEQQVRAEANFFPKFNGSAGVWRRSCLEGVGGWEADTLCEDLCLSVRANLAGWHFRFLPDVVAPAELPATIQAYKVQQSRWAKGASQCLRKYGRPILAAKQFSGAARVYALLSLAGYATNLLLIALLLLQLPMLWVSRPVTLPLAWFFTLAALGQPLLFALSQQQLYDNWLGKLARLPALLLVAVGLSVSNSWAVLSGLSGREPYFARTPKGYSYPLPSNKMIWLELLLALYAGVGLGLASGRDNMAASLFFLTCLLGFGYVIYLGLWESVREFLS